jgi:hypothetical protein
LLGKRRRWRHPQALEEVSIPTLSSPHPACLVNPNPNPQEATDIDGRPRRLSALAGRVTLVVNVASRCGFTDSNYRGLQSVWEKYHPHGLEILAFPSDQFGHQEPGSNAEIKAFCKGHYNTSFELFSKVGAGEGLRMCVQMRLSMRGSGGLRDASLSRECGSRSCFYLELGLKPSRSALCLSCRQQPTTRRTPATLRLRPPPTAADIMQQHYLGEVVLRPQ